MDKKLVKMLLILVGLIILLVLVVTVFGNAFKHTSFNYVTVRNNLQNAAINYTKKHKDKLPQTAKDYLELSDNFLMSEGYFKGYENLYNDDVACKGYVDVFKDKENAFTYITSLDCNDEKRDTLYDRVLDDNNYGVVSGSGLYAYYKGQFITSENKLNDSNVISKASYIFRGDETKNLYNFIQFENMLWRILEIDENGDLILMFDSTFSAPYSWDARYNGDYDDNTGINDYYKNGLKSNAAEVLGTFYLGGIPLEGGEAYQTYSHIIQMINLPMDLCVGKRSAVDEGYDGSIECSEKIKDQDVGLLPAYMYMRVSLDENCNTIMSPYCSNYNYLSSYEQSYWLLTTSAKQSNVCWYVNNTVNYEKCKNKFSFKPIIKIPGDLKVKNGEEGGVGSRSKPYRIYSFYKKTIVEEED